MMKGRINLDYERSPDPYDRHRALYLYLPTTEMTGDYTCKVSTLQNDVTATKRMTVFGEYHNYGQTARASHTHKRRPQLRYPNLLCSSKNPDSTSSHTGILTTSSYIQQIG